MNNIRSKRYTLYYKVTQTIHNMGVKGKAASILTVLLLFQFSFFIADAAAQSAKDEAKMAERLKQYFSKYKPKGTKLTQQPRMVGYEVDYENEELLITADEFFAAQEFTPDITANIY